MSEQNSKCTCDDLGDKYLFKVLLVHAILVPVTVFLAVLAGTGAFEVVHWLRTRNPTPPAPSQFPVFNPQDFPLPPVK